MACKASMEELEVRRLLSVASIGLNLDPIYDWRTIAPFNDLGTQFRTWGQPSSPYAPDPSIPVTKDNYPLTDASAMTFALAYPDGKYAVSYDGEGSLCFWMGSATTYTVTSHVGDHWTGVLDMHHDGNVLTMNVSGVNTANPIHNLHIISPDADPAISDTFRPVFLQKLAPFNGPIRAMDWLQTNNNTIVNWSDRTPANRFSYASYDERPGVPYEQVIKLANTLHRDLWFNIPVGATDDFVHKLAALLRDTLDPSLKVYVEYSNELWNPLFAQTATNLANARADSTLTATNDFGREAQEAAKRLVEISNFFRGDFGDTRFAAQVRPEFGSQAANSYFARSGLDYINAQFGNPKNFIAGLAIGDYVGDADSMSSIDDASLTLDGLFAWMNNFIDTTLDFWIKSSKGIADKYGLALEAYEGGQALTAYDGVNAALKVSAQDDPRMGDFYKHLIRNWVGNGGDNFLHYSVAGPWGAGGAWGMLQSIDQASSVKYAAMASMVGWGSVGASEELATVTPVGLTAGAHGATIQSGPKQETSMAEEKPGLHIDLDWKKQAQEEKKRLEEEEKKRAEERAAASAAPAAPSAVVPTGPGGAGAVPMSSAASGRARGARGQRELPPAGIPSLAQSLVTQTLYYLGDSAARTGDESSNMDMAKHLIDTMGVLEEKTHGRLTPEEQQVLDTALYEARMRFIAVAGQVIAGT